MTPAPVLGEVTRFRSLIAQLLGLHVDESKLGNLSRVLHRRAASDGEACAHYLARLALLNPAADEWARLAAELTVTETYFLRNVEQFNVYSELALPDRLGAQGEAGVRVLSAGCASGEEPYSLAMRARECFAHALHRVAITAIDINPLVLEKAARARYSKWSLRDFPAELRSRWFTPDADYFVLDATTRGLVKFAQHNLVHDAPDFWQPASLDIVFCRNVLMYFTPEQAQAVIARIALALVPGGYFFLGHAETLRGLSNDFHLRHTHGTFYYQRKAYTEGAQGLAPMAAGALAPGWQPLSVLGDTAWIAEIQRATDRIQALSAPLSEAAADAKQLAASGARAAPNLHRALEYLHHERYDQTLQQLGRLPVEQASDPDVLLLKAVSLSHSGALDAAEATCRALLERDELSAGAYYVLALCREGRADLPGALEHDQTAVYLDPCFAMPRLHQGLLARRQGDTATARRDLGQALLLFQKEDASRLLLFGGGFSREALIGLCRAELASLGAGK